MKIWGIDDVAEEASASWETFATSKSVNLTSGDGLKTVHIKVRDDVGNESAEVTDDITLNTTVPAVSYTHLPKVLAAAEEVQTISRSMLVWANTFPDKPVAIINYEFLDVDMAKPAEVGMTLSTIPGTYITSKYILGGYQAEYQFEMLYRIKPGDSIDARLEAVELLNRFGDWARTNNCLLYTSRCV